MYFCLFWIFKRSLAEEVALKVPLKVQKNPVLSFYQICFANGAVLVDALRAFTNKGIDRGK